MSRLGEAASTLLPGGLRRFLRRGARKVLRAFADDPAREAASAAAPTSATSSPPGCTAPISPNGVNGVLSGFTSRPARQLDADELARYQAEYAAQTLQFREEVRRRGLGDVDKFAWYHTIDLGDGLVTPGDYDYRGLLGDYPFPENMSGMSVLDVGSATGFFAFEFERRGAEVTSVELPSLADWDLVWSDREVLIPQMLAARTNPTIEDWVWRNMHGPFEFCHRLRGSRVRRCLSRVYDLTPQKLGRAQFELIFLGDVLGHLFSPLGALNALAPLCRKEMVISIDLADLPAVSLRYIGGEDCDRISQTYFQPNWEALRMMLKRVGFRNVEVCGVSRVLLRRTRWIWMDRHIVRATR